MTRQADVMSLIGAAARNVQDVVVWVAKPDHAQRVLGMDAVDHSVITIRIFVECDALGQQVRCDLFDFVTNRPHDGIGTIGASVVAQIDVELGRASSKTKPTP